jgi:hypothetical protein
MLLVSIRYIVRMPAAEPKVSCGLVSGSLGKISPGRNQIMLSRSVDRRGETISIHTVRSMVLSLSPNSHSAHVLDASYVLYGCCLGYVHISALQYVRIHPSRQRNDRWRAPFCARAPAGRNELKICSRSL